MVQVDDKGSRPTTSLSLFRAGEDRVCDLSQLRDGLVGKQSDQGGEPDEAERAGLLDIGFRREETSPDDEVEAKSKS